MSADYDAFRFDQDHILITLAMIEELVGRAEISQFEVISLGTLLQNTYMGVERILRLQVQSRGGKMPRGESWHKELIMAALREGFMDHDEFEELGELLAYRHLHVHGYAHRLKEEELRRLAGFTPELVRNYLEKAAKQLGYPRNSDPQI